MMQQYMKELEQDPFDAEEFVERLAWRTIAESKKDEDEDFNPILLHDSFVQAIKDLTLLQERQQKKCERLEAAVREDETLFRKEIHGLQDGNKNAEDTFKDLDGKINHVANKVLHLGDQLDSVNGPRARVVEAHRLMNYLNEFLTDGIITSPIFTEKSKIVEAAEIIQKLHVIIQDFPQPKFEKERKKIESSYDQMERELIEEFVLAQRKDDFARMKDIAHVLSNYKGYSQCIDAYIEFAQNGCLRSKDVFYNIFELCKKHHENIKFIFNKPEQVMAKFVLNIINLKLQEYVDSKFYSVDSYSYLSTLYELYSKTNQLTNDLSVFNMGNDKDYMKKLTGNIFAKYLEKYMSIEIKCLKERSSGNLRKYYESKNHQKKLLQTGGFQDLRRDLQAVIGTRTNFNIIQVDNYGGETFLSEELAITILQDTKKAFERCKLLSKPEERASNATQILDCLINSLLIEHIDYAVELGLQSIPVVEGARTPPTLYFFSIVHHCNNITHLIEKQVNDLVLPLILNSPKYKDYIMKKNFTMTDVEKKINTGVDRCLNAITSWVKLYLTAEQKKTDFKPETDDFATVASSACKAVVQYINSAINLIKSNLDGHNVSLVLQELGIRLHRVIYDHMLQFQYNTAGAMVAICDLNEYRLCTKELGSVVAKLFDTLHALCNLLLVKTENIKQVCSEDSLVDLDQTVLQNFIQLRSDFNRKQNILLR